MMSPHDSNEGISPAEKYFLNVYANSNIRMSRFLCFLDTYFLQCGIAEQIFDRKYRNNFYTVKCK